MRILKRAALVYIALLLISTVVRWTKSEPPPSPDKKFVTLQVIDREQAAADTIKLAYKDFPSKNSNGNSPVVLIHGSPGDSDAFNKMAPRLTENYRVIVPDLPGFGDSSKQIPDYSFRAHAFYARDLLNLLNIEKAHFVGFSMGGGVILNVEEMAPEKVKSLTLLSAIGVQEQELLGDYDWNHAVHGLQFAVFWLLQNFTPHFGFFDGTVMPYCRNFYDSDQRPLRKILETTEKPFLIIHGKDDFLVPVAAAREHARIVRQSEYHELDESHFFTFMNPEKATPLLLNFFDKVEEKKVAETRTK
jgi:pimeloyl-ACP methyl ester carboxylesterase